MSEIEVVEVGGRLVARLEFTLEELAELARLVLPNVSLDQKFRDGIVAIREMQSNVRFTDE